MAFVESYTDEQILDLLREYAAVPNLGRTPTKRQWDSYQRTHADLWQEEIDAGVVDRVPSADTIQRRFGSWSGAILAAGLEPNLVGRKKTRS